LPGILLGSVQEGLRVGRLLGRGQRGAGAGVVHHHAKQLDPQKQRAGQGRPLLVDALECDRPVTTIKVDSDPGVQLMDVFDQETSLRPRIRGLMRLLLGIEKVGERLPPTRALAELSLRLVRVIGRQFGEIERAQASKIVQITSFADLGAGGREAAGQLGDLSRPGEGRQREPLGNIEFPGNARAILTENGLCPIRRLDGLFPAPAQTGRRSGGPPAVALSSPAGRFSRRG